MLTIARYDFPYQAHIDRAKLESEGIPAFVQDEHTIGMQWLFANALGGVKLQVPTGFEQLAREVLGDPQSAEIATELAEEPEACPHCGSTDTEFHQIGRRWAFLSFLALDFPLFPVRRGFKCRHCGKVTETH